MKISKLAVKNYRTLEDLQLDFPAFYSAICGRNDSGKTNVVRAIRCVMKEEDPFVYTEGGEFSLKKDLTRWSDVQQGQRTITIGIEFLISPQKDTGLHKFFVDYLSLVETPNELVVEVDVCETGDVPQQVVVKAQEKLFEGLKAQEVLKRLQTSRTFLFHSSTDPRPPYLRGYRGVLRGVREEQNKQLENSKKGLNRALKRIAREQQQQIEELLGRLTQKYKVGLSCPTLEVERRTECTFC